MGKKKSLAQLPYPSKEWDDEKERQQPGWGATHGVEAVLSERPISAVRRKRLFSYPKVTKRPGEQI
jgi:hypothetical protein